MPSRPVLIGRGLVTHTPTNKNHRATTRATKTASTTQNLNQQPTQQTHHTTPTPTPVDMRVAVTRVQQHNGSPRYGGHSGRETPGPIPNPEVKPASANGTAPDRMWESRTPPNKL